MKFFNSAISTLQTLVVALGAALCVWGTIKLLEGYGNIDTGCVELIWKILSASLLNLTG